MSFRNRLLSTTFVPIVVGVGVGFTVAGCTAQADTPPAYQVASACNPCSPCNPCAAKKNPCNPCAAKNPCNPCAAANPCNPCAAKNPCNPCNPCAAKAACNPCNPCAANPCAANPCAANPCAANPCAANPCNPCAASACVVPRLAKNPCNPCAAKSPCNPCNPCAANPCAAKSPCNPCNPCAAKKNPCNPCAANPCNPCAANPCAAKSPCNPCNPCAAANPCNPCNPCAAAAAVELTDAEAAAAYNCIKGKLKTGYAKSKLMSAGGVAIAANYQGWKRFSTRAYVSDTHGGRYVQNYGNAVARDYGKYEKVGKMPVGSILAKDSFVVRGGKIMPGPLFVMEKMAAGFNPASGNWRYSLVMPNGKVIGRTNGKGSKNVQFCIGCHLAAEDTDSLYFLPDEYRVRN